MKTNEIQFTADGLANAAIHVLRNMDNVQDYVFQLIRNSLQENREKSIQADPEKSCLDVEILLDPAICPLSIRYVVTRDKVYYIVWLHLIQNEEMIRKAIMFANRITGELNLIGHIDVNTKDGLVSYLIGEDALRYVIYPELIVKHRQEFLIGYHALLWAYSQLIHHQGDEDQITGELEKYLSRYFKNGNVPPEGIDGLQ